MKWYIWGIVIVGVVILGAAAYNAWDANSKLTEMLGMSESSEEKSGSKSGSKSGEKSGSKDKANSEG